MANNLRLMLRIALIGGGVTVAPENGLRVHRLDGSLVDLLAPSRPRSRDYPLTPRWHSMTAKLSALVDHFRRSKSAYDKPAQLAQVTPPS